MTMSQRALALKLFEIGAVKFGEFKLKMHEQHPDAPMSPIYLNLRTADNPKPGPLTPEVMEMIGVELCNLISNELYVDFDCIAGIPNAGDPFAQAMIEATFVNEDWKPVLIPMIKTTAEDGSRQITGIDGEIVGDETDVVLVDDLITMADTKKEAVRAIKDAGLSVVTILVLVDREQGGVEMLGAEGIEVRTAFTMTELLDLYVAEGLITTETRYEVKGYQQAVAEYLASAEAA